MALNQTQRKQKQKKPEETMILETENLMVSPTGDSNPTMRISHFLKPIISPQSQPPVKPSLHSLTTKTNIKDLAKRVDFQGRPTPLLGWKAWVDELEKTHQSIWKKVGIFDAIKASTCKIRRDNEIVVALAERWCPETNTFVFPWGEATVTLEDVMVLGGFSVLGVSATDISFKDKNFMKIEAALKAAYKKIQSNNGYKQVHQTHYMKYFRGKGGEIEHVAFLVIWLLRYVFPCGYYMYQCSIVKVAPFAFSIARRTKFALAPAVLACIYNELSILKNKIVSWNTSEVKDDDDSKLILLAPFHLVQLWAWERFRRLAPRPVTLLHGEPRMARWKNVGKLASIGNHRLEIESSGDAFLWRPYVVSLKNWELPKFYSDKEMRVLLNSEAEDEFFSFARCLSPCELVGLNCLEQYLPHRIGMQFGYDQDIPDLFCHSNTNAELAWSNYDDKQFDGLKLYLPPRLFEGDVTVQYRDWWKSTVDVSDDKFSNFKRKARTRRARKMRKVSKIVVVGFGGDNENAPPCSLESCNGVRTSKISGPAAEMTKDKYQTVSLLIMGNEKKPDNALEPLLAENEQGGHCAEDPVIADGNEEGISASGSCRGQISEFKARIRRLQRLVALIKAC